MLRFALACSTLALPVAAADAVLKPVATLGFAKVSGSGRLSASPDGRTVIVGTQWYDWTTGEKIDPPCPLPDKAEWHAILADGRIAAFANRTLTVHDPKTGEARATISCGWSYGLDMSADARTVTDIHQSDDKHLELRIATAVDGYQWRNIEGARNAHGCVSADGSRVAWIDAAKQVHLTDVASRQALALVTAEATGFALSPDGRRACVTTKAAWEVFDATTGKSLRRIDKPDGFESGYALEFTGDGRHVIASGSRGGWATFPVAGDGKAAVVAARGGAWAQQALLADGKRILAVEANGVVRMYDVFSGKRRDANSSDERAFTGVRALGDRRALTFADDGRYAVWDTGTGRALRTGALPDRSPDGRPASYWWWRAGIGGETFAASETSQGLDVHVRSADGRPADPDAEKPWVTGAIEFLTDGRTVEGRNVGGTANPRTELRDLATGRRVGVLDLPPGRLRSGRLSFDPAFRTALTSAGAELVLHEVASGKRRWAVAVPPGPKSTTFGPGGGVVGTGVSADGRRLLAVTQEAATVFDAASRTALFSLPVHGGYPWALSRDGRWLAWTHSGKDIGIFLADLSGRTGASVTVASDAIGGVKSLDFTPDAKTLLVVPRDGLPQVWDIAAVTGAKAAPGDPAKPPADPWDALASPDAKAAGDVMAALARTPAFALAYLGERLTPVPATDTTDIAARLTELDSKDFATREAAEKVFAGVADQAEPRLRAALKTATNPEARRRLEKLLAVADAADERPDTLRAIRALEVLEAVGGAEAKKLVAKLADGAPAARVTAHAEQTLKRMK